MLGILTADVALGLVGFVTAAVFAGAGDGAGSAASVVAAERAEAERGDVAVPSGRAGLCQFV